MVALKHRHFGALLAICALVLSFFGVTQVVSASVPAHADAPACPAPVTNVSDKVTLDWDKAQLVDHTGHEVHAVAIDAATPSMIHSVSTVALAMVE